MLRAHLEGAESDALMEEEADQLLEVEDGATRKMASVEGEMGPRVELQEPGVSCLTARENSGSLTLSSPQKLLGRSVRRPSTQGRQPY